MRILFTLGDIDELYGNPSSIKVASLTSFLSVRAAPAGTCVQQLQSSVTHSGSENFVGYLSLIILELNITTLHQRNMLLCTEW